MVYSLVDVQATLDGPGGSIQLGAGAAVAKEGLSFDWADAKNNMLMGADGEGVHSLRASKASHFTLRYLLTSPVNAQLQQMYNTQIQSSALWGQNVLTIANPVTGDNVTGTQVAFQKGTGRTWAEDANFSEWVFDAIKTDVILGASL